MPDDFGKHVRASLREGLLACRSLLDGWIASLEVRERATSEQSAAPEVPADEADGIANP